MKRKIIVSILCISIASTMLVPNSGICLNVHAAGVAEKPVVPAEEKKPEETPVEAEVPADNDTGSEILDGNTSENEISGQPEQPEESEQPDEMEEPEQPDESEEPEQPDESGEPEQPDESQQPETSDQPDESQQLGTLGQSDGLGEPQKAVSPNQPEETRGLLPAAKPSVTAGIGFYIEELEEKYLIRFDEDFKDIVSEVEEEFLENLINLQESEIPEEEILKDDNSLKFTNWQDVMAVYLLNEKKSGTQKFIMNAEDKEGLAGIFAQMNTGTVEGNEVVIISQSIEEYEAAYPELTDEDGEFLQKYTSANCTLLCAAATGIEEFIIGSFGGEISEERVQVVAAAYSLLGKIPYFWGGKSTVIGWDSRWGKEAVVTAAGSRSSGTIRNYGLDCSGFITWAFINGYEDKYAATKVGEGTMSQWGKSVEITEDEALPGDLVFLRTPSERGINHVGIVVGRNDDGKLVVVHCNSSDNGVVAESAYDAGFRYIRRPEIFQNGKNSVAYLTQF